MSVRRAIQLVRRPVFTTREIAALAGTSLSSASQTLARMEQEHLLTRAARGIWCVTDDPRFTPFLLVLYLSGGHQAYVSFLSALHLHGMIGQIPQVVYAATTAHTRRRDTPVGTFCFHRIQPAFFSGFDWYREQSFLIASPEKALIDCLYLSSRKGGRFGHFPEIEPIAGFSVRRARDWVKKIPYPKIRAHVSAKLTALLESAREPGIA
ncbi:MAG: type IV toxin-antitoxin system AbiEi family antitoxin domain-containing protein [Deltaproteobacteria bacterium]|nr:type IV toxin-antitoxin system AbiEi family antitoxin domain-containing protein [Deltaproteobacteria bacterium]